MPDNKVRTTSDKGRLTIPKGIREKYGQTFEFRDVGDRIEMVPLVAATEE